MNRKLEDWEKERENIFRFYHKDNQTLALIGEKYGVTRERMRQVMEGLGIKRFTERSSQGKSMPRYVDILSYLKSGTRKGREATGVLRRLLKPINCGECGSKRNLHIHHIKYPALEIDDIQILCASCHYTKHRKSMSYARQLELYQRFNNGECYKDLAKHYNISIKNVYLILRKIRNGAETIRGT